MVDGGALALSAAQRSLVEKARAAQRVKAEKEVIKSSIQEASQRHVDETRQRCQGQYQARDAQARDRRLVIRHVGEELARVAQRDLVAGKSKKPFGAPGKKKGAPTGAREPTGSNNHDQASRGRAADSAVDANAYAHEHEHDEDRYGPIRRPPRPRKPNLWLQIFEQEKKEVAHEREEAKRRRLAAAAEFRVQLAQQEEHKRGLRVAERLREDEYARQQATQLAQWREQERARQRDKLLATEQEVKRCQEEALAQHERKVAARQAKEQRERKTVARYQVLIEEEQRTRERKKQAHKEEMARVAEANALQLSLKKQMQLREQEEEIRLQHAYEQKLALQEQQRERELQEVLAKQSRRVKMALLNVKSAEEKAREDEERAAVVQAQVRQREEEERRRRERKRVEAVERQTRALALQKEEKRQHVQQERQEEAVYAAGCKQDYQSWLQQQRAKQMQVKMKNLSNEVHVRAQMQEDAVRRTNEDKYGMSRREMELNTELLRKIGLQHTPADAPSR